MSVEDVLRKSADDFVLVVAVYADEQERDPEEVAIQALRDSLARLTESGALGNTVTDD